MDGHLYTENGPDCEPTNCVFIDHYSINQVGDEAELITPKIDLSSTVSAYLEFDYAYEVGRFLRRRL